MSDTEVDDTVCPVCEGSTYVGETISCEICKSQRQGLQGQGPQLGAEMGSVGNVASGSHLRASAREANKKCPQAVIRWKEFREGIFSGLET